MQDMSDPRSETIDASQLTIEQEKEALVQWANTMERRGDNFQAAMVDFYPQIIDKFGDHFHIRWLNIEDFERPVPVLIGDTMLLPINYGELVKSKEHEEHEELDRVIGKVIFMPTGIVVVADSTHNLNRHLVFDETITTLEDRVLFGLYKDIDSVRRIGVYTSKTGEMGRVLLTDTISYYFVGHKTAGQKLMNYLEYAIKQNDEQWQQQPTRTEIYEDLYSSLISD